MEIKEKIERVEQLRYEISNRTIGLYRMRIAKEYDRERERIKELKKELERLMSELEKEITYIFFNKKEIELLRSEFAKLSEDERRKAITEASGLVQKVNALLKKNAENRDLISSFIIEISSLPESERNEFKAFFEGEKDYLRTRANLKTLARICDLYGINCKRNLLNTELAKKESKVETGERALLYKILPFLDRGRAEREKRLKEIEQQLAQLDKKINEILNREEMKRFSIGIFTGSQEQQEYEKLQSELLELMKEKRTLLESKKSLQK
jgi:hypothetical protein